MDAPSFSSPPAPADRRPAPAPPLGGSRIDRRLATLARWTLPAYWVALAIGTHLPGFALGVPNRTRLFELDKALHVLAFGGLTALIFLALPRSGRPAWRAWGRAAAALALGVTYAGLDEVTQPWTGRELHLDDAVASWLGCGIAYLGFAPRPPARLGRKALAWAARLAVTLILPGVVYLTLAPGARDPILDLYRRAGMSPLEGDSFLHYRLSSLLLLLLAASAWLGLGRGRRAAAAAATALVVLGSGRLIEWIQLQTGRATHVDLRDVDAHEAGAALGIALWVAAVLLRPALPALGRSALAVLGLHQPGDGERSAEHDGRFVGHAAVVSGLTLVSRLSGLVRDAVLAKFLGLSIAADAFFIGFLVPNLFRRLFGEGALASAFIPQYARLRERDPALARRFVTAVIASLASLLAAVTVLAELALWAASAWGGWSERASLAIELTMLMLPYMPMVCLVAMLGGVLQVHRRFAPAATAPVVLNACMIGFCLWAGLGMDEPRWRPMIASVTGGGVLVAGLMQLGWLWLAVSRTAGRAWSLEGAREPLRDMLKVMGPMVVGLAVYQLNALFDSLIAFGLSATESGPDAFTFLGRSIAYPMIAGDVAALQWAQRLYQFPLGVFGIALATAIFPALAAAAGREERGGDGGEGTDGLRGFRAILRSGLKLTVFIGLPAAVGLVLVRRPLVSVVFERGAFEAGDVDRVATILVGYAVGIWAFTSIHVLTRGFYARQDSRTPVKVAVSMVGLNVAMNLALIWPLGAAGLAWSTAASGVAHAAALAVLLHRRIGGVLDRDLLVSWGKTAALTLLMLAAAWPLLNWAAERFDPWLVPTIVIPAAMAVYLAAAALLSADELRGLLKRA